MFTILVCSDMFGEKMNLELTFAAMPTINELTRKIEDVFRSESEVKRPPNFPREYEFRVARVQIYDDVLLKWVDLVTATQLHEYDQLYVFQPQSPWHVDVQRDLPPPRPPTAFNRSTLVAHHFGVPQTNHLHSTVERNISHGGHSQNYGQYHQQVGYMVDDDEKARIVFTELDKNQDGYITKADLKDCLLSRGIEFSEATVGDALFHSHPEGMISYVDFIDFGRRFPNILETLFYRSQAMIEMSMPQNVREIENRLKAQKSREAELLHELERVRNEAKTLEQQHIQESEQIRRQLEQRKVIDEEERELLKKEYELQKHREVLRQKEAEFLATARNFDVHAAQKGSPRRARTSYS